MATPFANALSRQALRTTVSDAPTAPKPIPLLTMFFVALVLRIVVASFLIGDHLNPARDHWQFGWETGRLARSLASGLGFSSPLFGDTGLSAWMAPLFPVLLAGIFKLFGIYSTTSAWIIVSLNSLFAALTCIPIVRATQLSFGRGAAYFAGWLWVLFPYSIYLSTARIWAHALAALLVALLFWLTVRLVRQDGWRDWLFYGFLWDLAALTEPSLLATLPCLLLWLIWRRNSLSKSSLAFVTLSLAVLLIVVTPWFVRNSLVFHRFVPLRDNFWLVLWQSNTGDTSDLYPDWANPPHSDSEMAELKRVGEISYMQEKQAQAIASLRAHPLLFSWITVRRIVFFWTGFWSLYPPYSRNEPFQIPNSFLSIGLTFAMLKGLRLAWRADIRAAAAYIMVLLVFPLLFYVTHPSIEYRHPMDPVVVAILGVFVAHAANRRPIALATETDVGLLAEQSNAC